MCSYLLNILQKLTQCSQYLDILYKVERKVFQDIEKVTLIDNTLRLEDANKFKNIMILYSSALKELETKISIINDEFKYIHNYNPIEHVKSRIKSIDSIAKKLEKKGLEFTYSNIVEQINDIAGIRIICSFIPDIYSIVDMIDNCPDIEILEKKDYIKNPKKSGYTSYHLIVSVPITFSTGLVYVKAEIQIRTMAMDFWASLEHKISYKFEGNVPNSVNKDLKDCAKMINKLDNKMLSLNETVNTLDTNSKESNLL